MSNLTRYDNDGHLDMRVSEDGEFVSHDDYEILQLRTYELEKCIEFMINQSEPFREEFADIDESVDLAISLIEPCSEE